MRTANYDSRKRRQRLIRTHTFQRPLQGQTHRKLVNRPFRLQKCCQDSFGTHDETLSIAMRVNDAD
jgi:hypothetical protein